MTDLNLNINTGLRLTINGDPERVISFDPGDVSFAEGFYKLLHEFEAKQGEYQARADALDADTTTDDHDLPANMPDRFVFMRDVCEFMHAQIDALFGDGTSLAVFQGSHNIDAITQFFEGITPFVERERQARVKKYSRQSRAGAMK